jgi:hypothetical protein
LSVVSLGVCREVCGWFSASGSRVRGGEELSSRRLGSDRRPSERLPVFCVSTQAASFCLACTYPAGSVHGALVCGLHVPYSWPRCSSCCWRCCCPGGWGTPARRCRRRCRPCLLCGRVLTLLGVCERCGVVRELGEKAER